MIPAKFRYELSAYDLRIETLSLKARVVTEVDVLEVGIADLRSGLGRFPVFGFDFKTDLEIDVDGRRSGINPYETLVLHSGHRCLIIQLVLMGRSIDLTHLWSFLGDTSICFVGVEMSTKIKKLREWKNGLLCAQSQPILETGTDIRDFVGTALSYSRLRNRPFDWESEIEGDLQKLTDQSTNNSLDWANLTSYSSAEDIKIAIHEASACIELAITILQKTRAF